MKADREDQLASDQAIEVTNSQMQHIVELIREAVSLQTFRVEDTKQAKFSKANKLLT